jgi:hypothetical protein
MHWHPRRNELDGVLIRSQDTTFLFALRERCDVFYSAKENNWKAGNISETLTMPFLVRTIRPAEGAGSASH